MPTLITHARPTGPQCQQALTRLPLPNLAALLQVLSAGSRHRCEEDSLSPLPEMLQAQALSLAAQDGLLPWAALQARALHLPDPGATEGWAWLTPCHWQVNADHVRMADPAESQISPEESHTVMELLRPYLLEDGITLHSLQDGNWLASGAAFLDLPTASLARASGGAVDHWMPRQPQAQPLRRLQNEMQMLLYTHPLNDARTAHGMLPITSFWVSGTGSLPAHYQPTQEATVVDALRLPNQQDDATTWTQAWQVLDQTVLKHLLEQTRRGEPVTLTLCGETTAQTFTLQAQSRWTRLRRRLVRTDPPAVLQNL
jgi:hypothetical protein